MTNAPATNGGRLLKRGDTSDPECWRTSHRLLVGQGILRGLGLEPEWQHSNYTTCEWGRERHTCDYRCKAVWPKWATGQIFDLAYRLADEVQTERGAYHRAEAAAAKAAAAKEEAAR